MTDNFDNPSPEAISALSPPGYEQTVFIEPSLPSEPFTLDDTDNPGDSVGPYRADDFETEPLSNILFSQPPDGAAQYLRVLAQDGDELTTVDGDGNEHTQRISVIPDNTMPLDGADAGSLSDAQRDAIVQQTGAES